MAKCCDPKDATREEYEAWRQTPDYAPMAADLNQERRAEPRGHRPTLAPPFTDADRYKYGVIAVCSDLHSTHTGTLDGIALTEYDARVAWLRWRIDDGWRVEAPCSWLPQLSETEDAIRAFARRVLADSLVWRPKA